MKVCALRLLIALAVLSGGACATKKDVDRIRDDLASLHNRQDEVEARLEQLQVSLAAALEEQKSLTLTTRGDIRRQLDDMERDLVAIQELLGQSQIVLRSLRERAERRPGAEEGLPAGAVGAAARDSGAAAAPLEGAGDARALYSAAMEQFRRGAFNTARTGFQEFLVAYPADELAPDAQYHLAETYREEKVNEEAIREYRRVVELYPNSRSAPTALYKAGLLQVEEGNKDDACQYFQRVVAGYPRSDEARLAGDQVQRLRCR
jgi:tol-pal system protein YbgF